MRENSNQVTDIECLQSQTLFFSHSYCVLSKVIAHNSGFLEYLHIHSQSQSHVLFLWWLMMIKTKPLIYVLNFCFLNFSPDEHYWSTLNALSVNPHLNTPGGYTGLNHVSNELLFCCWNFQVTKKNFLKGWNPRQFFLKFCKTYF